jgi:hypothetical protein
MEKTDGPYVVECCREIKKEDLPMGADMMAHGLVRQMTGPFASFDAAHTWMETIGIKSFDTLIIHILRSPENKS